MLLIFALTFLAVFLGTASLLTFPFSSRLRVRRALGNLAAYQVNIQRSEAQEATFTDRVVWPFLDRLAEFVKNRTSKQQVEKIQHRLILAGIRKLSAEKFASIKLGLGAAAFLVYLLIILPWLVMTGRSVWLGLPLIAFFYLLPELWLQRRIELRQKQIRASLADAVDILAIAIEAGLAFDAALVKVAKNMDGPLSEEFGRMLGELQIGVSRREAFRNLGDRTTVPELQSFCTTLVQADVLGISIGKILKEGAADLRTRQRQAAEETALKMPVKLVFPVVFCILPALIVVIIGPGVIRIAGTIFKIF